MRVARWCVFVLGVFVLGACNLPSQLVQSEASPVANLPESHPPQGTILRWMDGSKLVLIDMGPSQGSVWIQLTPITDFTYSLCVQAGECAPVPPGTFDNELSQLVAPIQDGPLTDSEYAPLQIYEAYCAWAGGRLATDEEVSSYLNRQIGKPKYDDIAVEKLAFCVVDAPHTAAPLCQTSAIYKKISTTQDTLVQNMKRVADFCQNGLGYATAAIDIAGCESATVVISIVGPNSIIGPNSIVGPNSIAAGGDTTCEQSEDDSIVCYGTPGSVASGTVLAQCESDALARSAGTETECPAGYESTPDSPALCSWSWGLVNQGCSPGMGPMPLANGAYTCELAPEFAESAKMEEPIPAGTLLSICPAGMYFDDELNVCVSLGAYDGRCMSGFEFDESLGCCQVAMPDGQYPGCPAGEAFDPLAGSCDPDLLFTAQGILVPVAFSLELPGCEGAGGEGGCELSSAKCAADGGQDFDAANCKCIPVQ